jgi:hypothetical protein
MPARTFDFSLLLSANIGAEFEPGSLRVPHTSTGRITGQMADLMMSARIPPEARQGNGRAIVGEKCGDEADKCGNRQDWQSSR